ncbi:Hypothetical protein PHPALM_13527, partial [Phytophthora palmivora]
MFFSSGPPRTYAVVSPCERIEDVALAMHPSQRVFARVTSTVELWSTSLPSAGRRLLARCQRGGQWVEQLEDDEDTSGRMRESETRRIWAVWVSGDRLAVVEKDSQSVEFYAFEGLHMLLQRAETPHLLAAEDPTVDANAMLDQPSFTEPEHEETERAKATSTGLQLAAKFVEDYPLNQGASQSDYEDVAVSMTAVSGSKYLFVGMASGMISVVEVADASDAMDGKSSWFSNADNSTKIWKIDVRTHLAIPEDADPPSCYDVTCATADLPSKITSLYLVASFEGGKCFIMLLSPAKKSIDQLLSL